MSKIKSGSAGKSDVYPTCEPIPSPFHMEGYPGPISKEEILATYTFPLAAADIRLHLGSLEFTNVNAVCSIASDPVMITSSDADFGLNVKVLPSFALYVLFMYRIGFASVPSILYVPPAIRISILRSPSAAVYVFAKRAALAIVLTGPEVPDMVEFSPVHASFPIESDTYML